MRGKRETLSRIASGIGFTRVLESLPDRPVLTILNYHRIGNAAETEFDSGTFSATAQDFERQVAHLKRHCRMLTLEEALTVAEGAPLEEPAAMITFDDGYLDNYDLAYPVLSRHGVQGVFFLPTAFVGTGRLPWWDVIAYIVKHSKSPRITLSYPQAHTFDLHRDGIERTVMLILRSYKLPATRDQERFLGELESACGAQRPAGDVQRCFLNWDEAREMAHGGMAFGSHTHNHEVLSKLEPARQFAEVSQSREILRSELHCNIDTLAYPVGARDTFTPATMTALRQAGYRGGFSFYGGFNRPGRIDPFDISRQGVDGQSHAYFRLRTALGFKTVRHWI